MQEIQIQNFQFIFFHGIVGGYLFPNLFPYSINFYLNSNKKLQSGSNTNNVVAECKLSVSDQKTKVAKLRKLQVPS